jgi:hypothetical protein
MHREGIMELTQLDKSSYLKGLLIVAKKDNQLNDYEKKFLKNIASKLGFASDFYEDIIRGLLINKYIPENPVKFSDKKIAELFVTDGIKLALSGKIITDSELDWLKQTALENNLDDEWFKNKVNKLKENVNFSQVSEYALFSII